MRNKTHIVCLVVIRDVDIPTVRDEVHRLHFPELVVLTGERHRVLHTQVFQWSIEDHAQ
jgi:hypothetical protein